MSSLVGDYTGFRAETARLTGLIGSASVLAPAHRKLIAEIALLRLAILIENSMKSVFCKLSCGATYINGNPAHPCPAEEYTRRDHSHAKLQPHQIPLQPAVE